MCDLFTRVEIAFYPEFINQWLRFGLPDGQHDLDRRRAIALFKPARVLCYIRWLANDYGTEDWRIVVVQTCAPSQELTRLQGIYPGGNVLARAVGNAKVKRVLAQLDPLEADSFDLSEISPAYYRHLHNRIMIGRPVRPYSIAQDSAHRMAQMVSR